VTAEIANRADALWRAVTYLSVAQLHVCGNPLAPGRLEAHDVKVRASGHWGTVPGAAWALTHVGLMADLRAGTEVVAVLGAAHAGVAQRALAWLTGDLDKADPRFARDATGLSTLVSTFPDADEWGSEVHPALTAGVYQGGWLGGALSFAQGLALDSPDRVVVPILGDGECETPTTAASWLAGAELVARVVPSSISTVSGWADHRCSAR
jgi:xylulose-5-phosphate/fructose-6-phosphate phosphoketolase